jgi:small subunit ribosomal protein S14
MAKKSSVNKNERRRKMVKQYAERRAALKRAAADQSISEQDRFAARLKLAALPRNSAAVRIRNRCDVTGRPRGVYRKFKMSRIALRELGSQGLIPGLVKSSW